MSLRPTAALFLDFFARHGKAPLGFPVPKFKVEFSDAVDPIDGLPLSNLIEPAFEVSGQPRHHDVRQNALFEKAQEMVGIKARISSHAADPVLVS
jgi:hypothetical protein